MGEDKAPFEDKTPNFSAFGTGKSDPAECAGGLKTRPLTVSVEGEGKHVKTYDINVLLNLALLEE